MEPNRKRPNGPKTSNNPLSKKTKKIEYALFKEYIISDLLYKISNNHL